MTVEMGWSRCGPNAWSKRCEDPGAGNQESGPLEALAEVRSFLGQEDVGGAAAA